jgi:putative peptidoglycan lipid II flippase
LTEKHALVHDEDFLAGIRLGIQLNLAMVLPVIMFMVVMAQPIISLVYQRGHFDAESTHLTSIAFWCYSVGLLGISLNTFFSRLFSIFQKNKIPFYIAIFTAISNIILNFILVKTALKHGGIALASSIAFSLSCILLFYFLSQEIRHRISYKFVIRDLVRISAICSFIGILVFIGYHHFLDEFLDKYIVSLFVKNVVGLLIIGTFAAILYLGMIRFLGPKEIRKRLKRMIA